MSGGNFPHEFLITMSTLPNFLAAHISRLGMSSAQFCFNLELPGNPPRRAPSLFLSQHKQSFQIKQRAEQWPALQMLSWDVKHGRLLVIQTGWHGEYLERWVCCLHVHSVSCLPLLLFLLLLSSVSVIHRGALLPPPASHLTTAFETRVFSGETAYFVLFCGDIFMCVQLSGEQQLQLSALCQKLSNRGGFSYHRWELKTLSSSLPVSLYNS